MSIEIKKENAQRVSLYNYVETLKDMQDSYLEIAGIYIKWRSDIHAAQICWNNAASSVCTGN